MKQERKDGRKRGERTQFAATIMIDNELRTMWEGLSNKSRFVNMMLRQKKLMWEKFGGSV